MRDQLNELMKLAKQLRETVQVNKVPEPSIHVSTWIRINRSGTTYYSVSFLQGSQKLEVHLFEDRGYVSNSISIDVERIDDAQLDEIILRSKEDIITFIAKLDEQREERRLSRIRELNKELAELREDVSAS
jgi:hypothetical protein